MPAFITTALAFLTTYWPALLALGAFTTGLSQLTQKIADMWGARYPWLARISNVIQTISIDYAKLLAEIGGALNIGPRAKKPPTGPSVAGVVFMVVLGLCGCMGAKSAIAEACTVIDSGNPVIGALCLTAEEIASLFGHVKAARVYRASHMSAAPSATVDICEGASK